MDRQGCRADSDGQEASEGKGDLDLKELLEFLARALVDNPDDVRVECVNEGDDTMMLELNVAEDDRGKVIGRQGRTVKALRTIMRACGAADGQKVLVDVVD